MKSFYKILIIAFIIVSIIIIKKNAHERLFCTAAPNVTMESFVINSFNKTKNMNAKELNDECSLLNSNLDVQDYSLITNIPSGKYEMAVKLLQLRIANEIIKYVEKQSEYKYYNTIKEIALSKKVKVILPTYMISKDNNEKRDYSTCTINDSSIISNIVTIISRMNVRFSYGKTRLFQEGCTVGTTDQIIIDGGSDAFIQIIGEKYLFTVDNSTFIIQKNADSFSNTLISMLNGKVVYEKCEPETLEEGTGEIH